MIDDNGDQFVRTSIAIWILTTVSAAFLFLRLWCRLRFSYLWWDDYVLTISWVCHYSNGSAFRGAGWRH